ncbi:MAG: hypothetical protein AAF892_15700 [Cyanobacteria bacterium P01_D01_bin.71]
MSLSRGDIAWPELQATAAVASSVEDKPVSQLAKAIFLACF